MTCALTQLEPWLCSRPPIVLALLALTGCADRREPLPKPSWAVCQAPPPRGADSFSSRMQAAMARMDDGMKGPRSGDPDRDFAALMIPHHRGAVDMALAELRFGKDERLRRLAAGIIVEQTSELAVLQSLLEAPAGAPAQPALAATDQLALAPGAGK